MLFEGYNFNQCYKHAGTSVRCSIISSKNNLAKFPSLDKIIEFSQITEFRKVF